MTLKNYMILKGEYYNSAQNMKNNKLDMHISN